ncbi:unnamed protein product [Meloidogyne enterolobii]|uniref:Uncharacterized protein n=1 Tax=Meloidogyne enterolobii TaxID=390850 RepID=A0ACB0YSG3_MELEN
MHSNNTTIFPILCPNILKIFYLLFALLLIFDGPLSVRAGYPTAALRKSLNDIRFRMQDLTPTNEDLDEFLDKRAAALLPRNLWKTCSSNVALFRWNLWQKEWRRFWQSFRICFKLS